MFDSVSEPVEAHVDGFGSVLSDGGVDDAVGCAVVGANGGRRLWMAHFGECCSHWNGELGVHVEGSYFGFGGRGHDIFDNLCGNGGGAVDELFGFVAHVVESAGSASGLGGDKVHCIAVDVEDHVAGTVECGGVWVAGAVIEEVVDCLHGFLSA